MKKKMLAVLAAFSPLAVLADGTATITPSSYTVPSTVTDSVNDLAGAANAYSATILPYIAYVGLAFIGIAVVFLLFKVFKRFVSGK